MGIVAGCRAGLELTHVQAADSIVVSCGAGREFIHGQNGSGCQR